MNWSILLSVWRKHAPLHEVVSLPGDTNPQPSLSIRQTICRRLSFKISLLLAHSSEFRHKPWHTHQVHFSTWAHLPGSHFANLGTPTRSAPRKTLSSLSLRASSFRPYSLWSIWYLNQKTRLLFSLPESLIVQRPYSLWST